MAPPMMSKKRKLEDAPGIEGKRISKKIRKQTHYSSPSPSSSSTGEEFGPVSLGDSDTDDPPCLSHERSSSDSNNQSDAGNSSEEDEQPSNTEPPKQKTRKADDPAAFSNSIAKILGSKLSTSKRADPVLARSATAQEANESLSNSRLEAKVRQKLREDRKKDLERGRVRDVLLGKDERAPNDGGDRGEELSVGKIQEQEKRLRKTAQRGVVKLFNAVRAAQVKGEEAARNAKSGGRDRKHEWVGEMSKQGFLNLVAGGGTASKSQAIAADVEEE
ncbi:MAG: hypothetical protein Q9195_004294 [Heterodermia aff. obscurata]